MEWISVKDRLPEQYTDVLVFTKGGTIAVDRFECMMSWDEARFYNYDYNITHWMPLPEPPEELDEIEETYMDDIGGIHSPCNCYNPYGYFCGDCNKLSCKDCKYRDLQSDEE